MAKKSRKRFKPTPPDPVATALSRITEVLQIYGPHMTLAEIDAIELAVVRGAGGVVYHQRATFHRDATGKLVAYRAR